MRATDDSITFIEKKYRDKEPDYADFSIMHQQELLRRLNEEWTRAGCKEVPAASAGKQGHPAKK
jgi:hypothetical protein